MARTGLSLDPRSRPGTILPGYGTNPLEVAQGRMKAEQAAGLQADKLAADKAKADKAAATAAASIPDLGTAFIPHTQEALGLIGAFNTNSGKRLQKYAQTKDPKDDPTDPTSPAFLENEAEKQSIKQYVDNSAQMKTEWNEFVKDYDANPGKYTPEERLAMEQYTHSSPTLRVTGELKKPDIVGYWDKQKWIADTFAPLEATGWQDSVYDPELDIFTDTGGGGITETRIKDQAYATSEPGTQANMRLTREIAQLPATEQKRITEAAAKEGVTPAQYKAYEDMKGLAYKTYTEKQHKAGLKESKYGSGWGNDEVSADRFVKSLIGVSQNNPEIMKQMFYPVKSGQFPQYTYAKAYTNVFNGEQVGVTGEKMDIPVFIEAVFQNPDGTITVSTTEESDEAIVGPDGGYTGKKKKKSITMPQEDFANDMAERMTEHNKELKMPVVARKLHEYGVVDESGNINVGPKSKSPQSGRVSTNPYNQTPATTPKKF